MTRKRPTLVLVVGILNIILGALGLICMLCTGLSIAMVRSIPTPPNQPPELATSYQLNRLQEEIPNYLGIQLGIYGANLLLGALFLIGGIGLLRMRNWARLLSVWTAFLSILVQLGSAIWTVTVVSPVQEKIGEETLQKVQGQLGAQAANIAELTKSMQKAGLIFTAVIYGVLLLYLLTVIVLLLLPNVKAAFAGTGKASNEPEDYHNVPIDE